MENILSKITDYPPFSWKLGYASQKKYPWKSFTLLVVVLVSISLLILLPLNCEYIGMFQAVHTIVALKMHLLAIKIL